MGEEGESGLGPAICAPGGAGALVQGAAAAFFAPGASTTPPPAIPRPSMGPRLAHAAQEPLRDASVKPAGVMRQACARDSRSTRSNRPKDRGSRGRCARGSRCWQELGSTGVGSASKDGTHHCVLPGCPKLISLLLQQQSITPHPTRSSALRTRPNRRHVLRPRRVGAGQLGPCGPAQGQPDTTAAQVRIARDAGRLRQYLLQLSDQYPVATAAAGTTPTMTVRPRGCCRSRKPMRRCTRCCTCRARARSRGTRRGRCALSSGECSRARGSARRRPPSRPAGGRTRGTRTGPRTAAAS